MVECNWFLLSSYVLYFMHSKALFWKGVHRFHQAAKGVPGPKWTSINGSQESTWGDLKMRNAGGGSCVCARARTRTQAHSDSCWECGVGLSPGIAALAGSWQHCDGCLPEFCFSGHPEKWKPAPLTHGEDTASIKPEKHNLLPACFQFQAMPWKGQLLLNMNI